MKYAESVVTVSLRLEKKDAMHVKAQTLSSLILEGMGKILPWKL
jgi:hypothetical protein